MSTLLIMTANDIESMCNDTNSVLCFALTKIELLDRLYDFLGENPRGGNACFAYGPDDDVKYLRIKGTQFAVNGEWLPIKSTPLEICEALSRI